MQLTFKVQAPRQRVFSSLLNHKSFTQDHPLIYDMIPMASGGYEVHEEVRFGIIPYRFKYKADIAGNDGENDITILARVNPLVLINMNFQLSDGIGETLVKETVTIISKLPIKSFMYKLIRNQHELLFKNMQVRLLNAVL